MRNVQKLLQLIVDNKDKTTTLRAETLDTGKNVLWMYDVIDAWYGISAIDVAKALEGFGGEDVTVRLNSPGGDVFEGRAIQTLLKQYAGKVHIMIDSLAASAATTIALGGDTREMADGAFFMVHNSWTLSYGNKKELRKTADLLEQIDGAIGKDYAAVTGENRENVATWMDEETWFAADAAKDVGFIDSIYTNDTDEQTENRNAWNLAAYSNVPKALTEKPEPEPNMAALNRERLGRHLDMLERSIS